MFYFCLSAFLMAVIILSFCCIQNKTPVDFYVEVDWNLLFAVFVTFLIFYSIAVNL